MTGTNDTTVMGTVTMEETPTTRTSRKSPVPPTAPSRPPAFLTIDEVAAVLRVSVRSVYRLVDTGRILPPTRFGSLLRWNAAAFDAWIAEGSPPYRSGRPGRR